MIDDTTLSRLRVAAGEDGVSVRPTDLDNASSDRWPRLGVLKLSRASPDWRPEAVVWPADERAVAAVLRTCRDAGIPLVPRGGGSGLCGGAVPVAGGVVLDMSNIFPPYRQFNVPITPTERPACNRIFSMRNAVVVLPFVPVIPIILSFSDGLP